jgi:hypothetical protein
MIAADLHVPVLPALMAVLHRGTTVFSDDALTAARTGGDSRRHPPQRYRRRDQEQQ